jgi:hypothetical protein
MVGSGARSEVGQKIRAANLPSGAIELDQLAGPEDVDAPNCRTGANHEAVPHAAGDSLRVQVRSAKQVGGQKDAKLGCEGHPTNQRQGSKARAGKGA